MSNNELVQGDEQPILSLIQKIKDGATDPTTLTKELRQSCVEVFLGEGYSISQMAQLLKRSEKTIKRDVEEIRERNSLEPDTDLVKKIAGELIWYAHVHRNHLMRLARGKEGSVAEKAQAEYYAYLIAADLTTKLQSLGYLPSAPQAVIGEIFYRNSDEAQELLALDKQLVEMKKINDIAGDAGLNAEIKVIENNLESLKNNAPNVQKEGGNDNETK